MKINLCAELMPCCDDDKTNCADSCHGQEFITNSSLVIGIGFKKRTIKMRRILIL